jgi:hypothetical protein
MKLTSMKNPKRILLRKLSEMPNLAVNDNMDMKNMITKLKVPSYHLDGGGGGEYVILKFNKTHSGIRIIKIGQSGLANQTLWFCQS